MSDNLKGNTEVEVETEEHQLNKALNFLLTKELSNYSLAKKKDYLLQKLPREIVNKALEMYPQISNHINQIVTSSTKKRLNPYISALKDSAMMIAIAVSTIGVNLFIVNTLFLLGFV